MKKYNRTKLICLQHGGNYGVSSFHPLEEHELRIASKFYSWGWRTGKRFYKIIPFPRSKVYKKSLVKSKKEILLVLNCWPRYLYRFQLPTNFNNKQYFEWQHRFYKTLKKKVREKITIRLFPHDYGQDYKQRWFDLNPNIRFDDEKIPFMESVERCALIVHDHLATTYLETLAHNKPTILFWNPFAFPVRKEAKPYFTLLRRAGILFYNPEKAAKAISRIKELSL